MMDQEDLGGEPPCLLPLIDEEGRMPDAYGEVAACIRVKRAYESPDDGDGYRVLVDRIWPRGVKHEQARIDAWLKDIAPSTELRRWFGHDPGKWDEFRARYRRELDAPERRPLLDDLLAHARHGSLTLVYGARDTEHNNAVALRETLIALGRSR